MSSQNVQLLMENAQNTVKNLQALRQQDKKIPADEYLRLVQQLNKHMVALEHEDISEETMEPLKQEHLNDAYSVTADRFDCDGVDDLEKLMADALTIAMYELASAAAFSFCNATKKKLTCNFLLHNTFDSLEPFIAKQLDNIGHINFEVFACYEMAEHVVPLCKRLGHLESIQFTFKKEIKTEELKKLIGSLLNECPHVTSLKLTDLSQEQVDALEPLLLKSEHIQNLEAPSTKLSSALAEHLKRNRVVALVQSHCGQAKQALLEGKLENFAEAISQAREKSLSVSDQRIDALFQEVFGKTPDGLDFEKLKQHPNANEGTTNKIFYQLFYGLAQNSPLAWNLVLKGLSMAGRSGFASEMLNNAYPFENKLSIDDHQRLIDAGVDFNLGARRYSGNTAVIIRTVHERINDVVGSVHDYSEPLSLTVLLYLSHAQATEVEEATQLLKAHKKDLIKALCTLPEDGKVSEAHLKLLERALNGDNPLATVINERTGITYGVRETFWDNLKGKSDTWVEINKVYTQWREQADFKKVCKEETVKDIFSALAELKPETVPKAVIKRLWVLMKDGDIPTFKSTNEGKDFLINGCFYSAKWFQTLIPLCLAFIPAQKVQQADEGWMSKFQTNKDELCKALINLSEIDRLDTGLAILKEAREGDSVMATIINKSNTVMPTWFKNQASGSSTRQQIDKIVETRIREKASQVIEMN